jgi:hypothetical protein
MMKLKSKKLKEVPEIQNNKVRLLESLESI